MTPEPREAGPGAEPTPRADRKPKDPPFARWQQRFRKAIPSGSGFESTRNLTKWLLLSTTIGIVAGLGAIVFAAGP